MNFEANWIFFNFSGHGVNDFYEINIEKEKKTTCNLAVNQDMDNRTLMTKDPTVIIL